LKKSVSSRLADLFTSDDGVGQGGSARPQLELVQLIFDAVPDLVCIQDQNSVIRLANLALSEHTGLQNNQIVGRKCSELFISNHSKAPDSVAELSSVVDAFEQAEEVMVNKAGEMCLFDSLKFPLFDSQNCFRGILSFSRNMTAQKHREEERELLINRLKDTIAILEKQSKLLKKMNTQLENLATTDDLTKVSNRRFFDYHFGREWRRCCRERAPLALMIFDIDFFKRYNDYYGHIKGDMCLAAVAKALNEHTCRRPGDVFARFGGEEFVGLLPNTIDGLETLAERCVKAVFDLGIAHVQSSIEGHVVTVSIGAVVGFPHLLDNSLDLLDLADQQLYLAKKSGRNTFEYFKPCKNSNDDVDNAVHRRSTTGQRISQF
jgi:diguanylate cyclase (GGDEF)-like protein/PAS domain S-box-containing protein